MSATLWINSEREETIELGGAFELLKVHAELAHACGEDYSRFPELFEVVGAVLDQEDVAPEWLEKVRAQAREALKLEGLGEDAKWVLTQLAGEVGVVGNKALEDYLQKSGFTGVKKDKLGRKNCYQDGVKVPCPEGKPKPPQLVKPTGPAGAKDKFGSKPGSEHAQINAALSGQPQTMAGLLKASGVRPKLFKGKEPQMGTYYSHLKKLISQGLVEKTPEGYKLAGTPTPTAPKPKPDVKGMVDLIHKVKADPTPLGVGELAEKLQLLGVGDLVKLQAALVDQGAYITGAPGGTLTQNLLLYAQAPEDYPGPPDSEEIEFPPEADAKAALNAPLTSMEKEGLDNLLKKVDVHLLDPSWQKKPGLKPAYGGVIFNEEGKILLREPTNHFGGYAWTFPKGGTEKGDHPVDTALREVLEESGHKGQIVGLVPGNFAGDTSQSFFFLMHSTGEDLNKMDLETQATKWVTPAEAKEFIGLSTTKAGKERDLAILEAAVKQYEKLGGKVAGAGKGVEPATSPGTPKPPAPKFTGVDANGHHWVNGVQVKKPVLPADSGWLNVKEVLGAAEYWVNYKGGVDEAIQHAQAALGATTGQEKGNWQTLLAVLFSLKGGAVPGEGGSGDIDPALNLPDPALLVQINQAIVDHVIHFGAGKTLEEIAASIAGQSNHPAEPEYYANQIANKVGLAKRTVLAALNQLIAAEKGGGPTPPTPSAPTLNLPDPTLLVQINKTIVDYDILFGAGTTLDEIAASIAGETNSHAPPAYYAGKLAGKNGLDKQTVLDALNQLVAAKKSELAGKTPTPTPAPTPTPPPPTPADPVQDLLGAYPDLVKPYTNNRLLVSVPQDSPEGQELLALGAQWSASQQVWKVANSKAGAVADVLTKHGHGFPQEDPATLEVVKKLGGHSGADATLVKDAKGRLWVRKKEVHGGQTSEETAADGAYRAAGIGAPLSKMVGGYKLAKFVEGEGLKKHLNNPKVLAEVRKGYVLDCLLGNWDVVGADFDNILVGKDGKVHRIDNGGALRFRAQGELKLPQQWGDTVPEIETLKDPYKNPQAAQAFKGVTDQEISDQVKALNSNRGKILAALPAAVRDKVGKRLDWLVKTHSKLLSHKEGSIYTGKGADWKATPPSPTTTYKASPNEANNPIFHTYQNTEARKKVRKEQYAPSFKEHMEAVHKKLTATEKKDAKWFTGQGSGAVNHLMRKCPETLDCLGEKAAKVAAIAKAIAKAGTFAQPVMVWRNTGLHSQYQDGKDFLEGLQHALNTGDDVRLPGFKSCSMSPDRSIGDGDIKLEIKARSGLWVETFSSYPSEQELIQGHNIRYRVVAIKTADELPASEWGTHPTHIIQLEEVLGV